MVLGNGGKHVLRRVSKYTYLGVDFFYNYSIGAWVCISTMC